MQISRQVNGSTDLQVEQPLFTLDLDFLVPFRGAFAISSIAYRMSVAVNLLNVRLEHK